MAVIFIVTQPNLYLALGLSTDTKPTNPPDSCVFLETDTAQLFSSLGSTWILKTTGTELSLTDVTDNNANLDRHGFMPKLSGVSTEFANGIGGFSTPAGGGDALVANPLSQFAQTTSLQLKNTISDETGSGALVFANSPVITSPTGIVKGDVGLSSADNVSDVDKPVSTAQAAADTIAKARVNHTGTQPASTVSDFNAAALLAAPAETTTTQGALINAATGKTTPVDADFVGLMDSAAANILKKLSWANIKATLKTYFDTLYPSGSGTSTGSNTGDILTEFQDEGINQQTNPTVVNFVGAGVATAASSGVVTVTIPGGGGGSADIALSLRAPAIDETIPAGSSAVVVRKYSIASTKKLTIGLGSIFRIL